MASKDPTLPAPALISRRKTAMSLQLNTLGLVALGSIGFLAYNVLSLPHLPEAHPLPPHALESLSKCQSLNLKPGPPKSFWSRAESERWEPGTPPTLIQNATIWTGGDNGDEVVLGDILLDKGIIKAVGRVPSGLLDAVGNKLVVKNVQGAWVSPVISALIVCPSYEVRILVQALQVESNVRNLGAADTNSLKAPIMPYLRSLDGFNTHDTAFALSRSGGVATALILPGSADNIGGQAFVVKIRKTSHGGPSSMVLEPPATLHINGTRGEADGVRWRHIKHAVRRAEPHSAPIRQLIIGNTHRPIVRIWEFRKAYNSAREVKQQQDAFCARADAGTVDWSKESFPEDLQFEALVDVLRGRVKLTNEFKFPVAAFHHAHEAYLVPDILKSAWGDVPPAVALFATNARYKYEAYRGSEFAPKILHDNGFRVVMKSDHPVLNSRYLLYEAAQAHYYGLPAGSALSSVITTPAEVAGFGHRLGRVQNGYDADIVVWDSHPLTLGATPKQLYIDGIAQLSDPVVVSKPSTFQRIPATPNWGKAPQEAVEYDGLPPLQSNSGKDQSQAVVFTRVKDVWTSSSGELQLQSLPADSVVVVSSGRITCVGSASRCSSSLSNTKVVDLAHGSLSPGLISFGAPLGLEEISAESSTNDGTVPDPFDENGVPKVAGGDDLVVRAIDGLSFVGPPGGCHYGRKRASLVRFVLWRECRLPDRSIAQARGWTRLQRQRIYPNCNTPSAFIEESCQKRQTRSGSQSPWLHKADDMATLLELKSEIEDLTSVPLRLTFAGATEAHLIAKEIAEAGVGVIVIPSRSFPNSLITKLLKANVTVGLGVVEAWEARNTRFDIGWAALESDGDINKQDALALGTTNLQKLLGLEGSELLGDLIAYHGGDCFDLASRPVAVVSAARGTVDLF
ncbi:amidohydrolase [Rhizoctonia solani AG-1 IA]|uniref:Amidohydrolase n=1 Tax=Thanatephorus cucumeris (strain AG1-IA) TaxID=983506 RepID=L8WSJ4_THACA|nr:amidohydrolase [Rhizoctonia solani AG-1 IA]